MRAPFDGRVIDLDIAQGEFAATGRRLFTLIDTRNWYVIANFRETALKDIRPGHDGRGLSHGRPEPALHRHRPSIGFGVFPEEGGASANGLPRVPRSINWVRVAQRFPVRIRVDAPPADLFRIGASAVALIPPESAQTKRATAALTGAQAMTTAAPALEAAAAAPRRGSISCAPSSRRRPAASTLRCASWSRATIVLVTSMTLEVPTSACRASSSCSSPSHPSVTARTRWSSRSRAPWRSSWSRSPSRSRLLIFRFTIDYPATAPWRDGARVLRRDVRRPCARVGRCRLPDRARRLREPGLCRSCSRAREQIVRAVLWVWVAWCTRRRSPSA